MLEALRDSRTMNWNFFSKKKSALKHRLEAYEAYAMPFPGTARRLSIEQCEGNLGYLLDNRTHRQAVLGELLRHWNIDIYDRTNVAALLTSMDSWAVREWPTAFEKELGDRSTWHRSAKNGRHIVYSMLMDIAILLGELLIEQAPSCCWGLDLTEDSRDTPMESYKRPTLLIHGRDGDFRGVLDLEAILFGHYQNSEHLDVVDLQLFRRVVLENVHEAGDPWKDGVRI